MKCNFTGVAKAKRQCRRQKCFLHCLFFMPKRKDIILRSLNGLRTRLISENRYTDAIFVWIYLYSSSFSLTYIHSPLVADHFSVNSLPLAAAVNGFVMELFYCFQHCTVIIRFGIYFTDKCFHFFCIASSLSKVITCSNCAIVKLCPRFSNVFFSASVSVAPSKSNLLAR